MCTFIFEYGLVHATSDRLTMLRRCRCIVSFSQNAARCPSLSHRSHQWTDIFCIHTIYTSHKIAAMHAIRILPNKMDIFVTWMHTCQPRMFDAFCGPVRKYSRPCTEARGNAIDRLAFPRLPENANATVIIEIHAKSVTMHILSRLWHTNPDNRYEYRYALASVAWLEDLTPLRRGPVCSCRCLPDRRSDLTILPICAFGWHCLLKPFVITVLMVHIDERFRGMCAR